MKTRLPLQAAFQQSPGQSLDGKTTKDNKTPENRCSPKEKKFKTHSRPPPPDAIAVAPGKGETFAKILKSVRKDIYVEKKGASIISIGESNEVVISHPK